MIRKRVRVGEQGVARAVFRNPGKSHRGARNKALGIGDELVEILVGPRAALGLQGGGEIEPASLALMVADDPVKIRTDAVGTALLAGMTGGAFLRRRSALLVGRGV